MSDIVIAQSRIQKINGLVDSIKAGLESSVENIIKLGEELLDIKDDLDHGQFQAWVESNFRFSYATARRWMKVAENKKDVLKQLKGGNLANMAELYSVKTATMALAGPKAAPKAKAQRMLPQAEKEAEKGDWSRTSSVPLTKHKVLSRGGRVLVLPEGATTPTLVFQGTFYLDAIPGMEWAHRDVQAGIDEGLQLLFENYFYALEKGGSGEPEPEARPETDVTPAPEPAPAQPALEAPAKPVYKGSLDEDEE